MNISREAVRDGDLPWEGDFVRWAEKVANGRNYCGAMIFLITEGAGYSRIDIPLGPPGMYESDIVATLLSALAGCDLGLAASSLCALTKNRRDALLTEADA